MYWTEKDVPRSGYHSIKQSRMNGTNQKTLAKYNALFYRWAPNSLTIDIAANRLYWLGYHDYVLEYIDLDAPVIRIQTLLRHFDYLWSPFGIAQDDDHLYWTDAYEDVLVRVDKRSGGNLTVLEKDLRYPRGVAVYLRGPEIPGICGATQQSMLDVLLRFYEASLMTAQQSTVGNLA